LIQVEDIRIFSFIIVVSIRRYENSFGTAEKNFFDSLEKKSTALFVLFKICDLDKGLLTKISSTASEYVYLRDEDN
jgi:hypothetical protein